MKRKGWMFLVLVILIGAKGNSLQARSQKGCDTLLYFVYENAPRMEKILPGPPALQDARFYYDWVQYCDTKALRDTPRGDTARKDARFSASYMMERFGQAIGCKMTPATHPELFQLLNSIHAAERSAGASAKKYFRRKRPYQQFHEPTGLPQHERATDFTSYPSGHTSSAWLAGMLFSALAPDCQEAIMKTAYEMGQSRVILGFHYQSDVDDGRLTGSVVFARLCSEPAFLQQLQKAQKEFNRNRLGV